MSRGMEMVEDCEPIGVGTTGTIGSLMCRELESMRRMEHLQKTARRLPRSDAVSIPCGRPLPLSLSGYRLSIGPRKSHDAGVRSKPCGGPSTPRVSNADGCDGRKSAGKGEGEGKAGLGLGLGRHQSLTNFGAEGRRAEYSWPGKAVPRKSVSLDAPGAVDAFCVKADFAATPARGRARDRGGEFRTPILRFEGKEAEAEGARKSVERRGGTCSFVEVVDLKCNGGDKLWGSPIANRLRRLSFSRLSDAL